MLAAAGAAGATAATAAVNTTRAMSATQAVPAGDQTDYVEQYPPRRRSGAFGGSNGSA